MKKTLRFFPVLASFFIPFFVYFYTLCPTISVHADAAELATVVLTKGIAHPPGYPLFTLLAMPFSWLPFGEPAWRINFASAFFASLTCLVIYLFLKRLTKNKIAALAGALTLAFSKFFWHNALISEVFTLNTLLAGLLLLVFQIWQEKQEKQWLFLFLLLAGLGLTNHHTIVFLYPLFFIWFLIKKGWRKLQWLDYLKGVAIFLVGFFPYLYVIFAAKTHPFLNWENPQNLIGFIKLFTRATYGSLSISAAGITKIALVNRILGLARLFLAIFSLGLIPVILGIYWGIRKQKEWLIFVLSAFLITGPLFVLYTGLNTGSPDFLFIVERFLIFPTVFLAILAGFGFVWVNKLMKKQWLNWLILIFPLGMLFLSFNSVNQRNNYFGRYLAEDLFKTVPQESILLVEGDAKVGAAFYYQKVLGKRKDAKIIVADFLMSIADWYRQQVKQEFPEIYIPENKENRQQFMDGFIIVNSQKYPVISAMRMLRQNIGVRTMAETVGLTENFWMEEKKITATEAEAEIDKNMAKYQNLIQKKTYSLGSAEGILLGEYAYPYIRLANSYFRHGLMDDAERLYWKVLDVAPNNYYTYADLGDIAATRGDREKAIEYWQKFVDANPYYPRADEVREKIKKMRGEE